MSLVKCLYGRTLENLTCLSTLETSSYLSEKVQAFAERNAWTQWLKGIQLSFHTMPHHSNFFFQFYFLEQKQTNIVVWKFQTPQAVSSKLRLKLLQGPCNFKSPFWLEKVCCIKWNVITLRSHRTWKAKAFSHTI